MNLCEKKIFTYLTLTFALAFIWYYLIIKFNAMGSIYVLALMWAPGISAILVNLIFDKRFKGLPWKVGKVRYMVFAYFIPLIVCILIYGLTWGTGIGGFKPIGLIRFLVLSTFGIIISILSAAGEEIGWRGFLVPKLYEKYGFIKLSIISALVWYIYHLPLILFSTYNNKNVLFSAITFFCSITAFTFIVNYLALRSKSIWPAILMHASHNIFFQEVFDKMTIDNGYTKYIISEFGIGSVIFYTLVAIIFIHKAKDEGLYTSYVTLEKKEGLDESGI